MEKSISLSLMSLMLVLASSFVYPVDMTEALATRALLPYLTSRSRTSFADGDNDRLRALAWHPTAQMFAVAGGPRSTNAEVMLYNVKSDSTGSYLEGVSGSITLGSGYTAKAAAWSSNGNYFAVGGSGVSTNQLKIYSYTSSTSLFTSVFSLTWGDAGSSINSVAWHPSGKYLAVGGSGQTSSYSVIIYHLDYVTPLMTAVASVNLGSNAVVNALQWEKDGSYLAIGCRNESSGTAALQTYKFTAYCTASGGGFDFTKISTADFGGSAAYVRTLAWSPDNNFIVAGGYSGGTSDDYEVKLYAVAEGMLSRLSDGNIDFGATASGAYVSSLAWDPNQEYVLVGGYLYENSRQFRLYKFDGSSLVVKQGSQHTFGTNASSYVAALAWQPARTFVVVGGYLPSNSKELWLMEFVAA